MSSTVRGQSERWRCLNEEISTELSWSSEVKSPEPPDRTLAAASFCHSVVSLSRDSVMTSIMSLKMPIFLYWHVFTRKRLVPLNEAKSHILLVFNESSLVWQTDAFGLSLVWWWLAALCAACFHGVVFCWPNLNSAGPVCTSIQERLPTQREGYFEWSA